MEDKIMKLFDFKKLFVVIFAALITMSVAVGCGGDDDSHTPDNTPEKPSNNTDDNHNQDSYSDQNKEPDISEEEPILEETHFTIVFNSDGGSDVSTQIVIQNAKIEKPADPKKDGFSFVAWNNGETEYDFDTPVTANITLTAIWQKDVVTVTSVILDKETIDITIGQSKTLTLVVEPNNATYESISWFSDNPTVVSVNEKGTIKALTPGQATITVCIGEKCAKCIVTTRNIIIPEGCIAGAFSVSDDKMIAFSSGNLQYKASTQTWRFASSQTDVIGYDNRYISRSYDGWIDLFGWGTGDNPANFSTNKNNYSEFYDWGRNIEDGNTWYTLSTEEWRYLLEIRTNAKEKIGVASVNGTNGLILLPDNFNIPSDLTFNCGVASQSGSTYFKTVNEYSAEQWAMMESVGAVFLPTASQRKGDMISYVGDKGAYWTSTPIGLYGARELYFISDVISSPIYHSTGRYYGFSVRLVRTL